MTCRERLMESDCAHNVNPDYVGGAFGCPHSTYPNTSGLKDMIAPEYCKGMKSYEECTKCWDREIPEDDSIEGKFTIATPVEKNPPNLFYRQLEKECTPSEKPHILDSGNRTVFESGAVRDIQEGKGRCDLLPLDVVSFFYAHDEDLFDQDSPQAWVFYYISRFLLDGHVENLRLALKRSRIFADPETMFLETAVHYEEGAKKYDENNWKKGIPVKRYIDSGVRHYLKFLRGDTDERHDRAFCWNMMGAIWTCKHMPELNEYRKEPKEG